MLIYKNQDYVETGKLGTHIKTGLAVKEMEAEDSSRIWVSADGQVFED